jgi:L-gulonolactone oxidase
MSQYVHDYHWSNWIHNRSCEADLYEPACLEDLRAAVREAARRIAIRPVGASYAWSSLVPTPGSLIRLNRLNRLLAVDASRGTVRVECGMTIKDLVGFVASHGLTLISPPIFPSLSVGGALAVGAHGTGQRWTTLSDSLIEITLVDAAGEVHTLKKSIDGDRFRAAAVGLGAFGVMYAVTLQCEPAFNVRLERGFRTTTEVLDALDDLLATYEFVELYWFPGTDNVWTILMNRSDAPLDISAWPRIRRRALDLVTDAATRAILPRLARRYPKLTIELLDLAYHVMQPTVEGPAAAAERTPLRFRLPGIDPQGERNAQWIADLLNKLIDLDSSDIEPANTAMHYVNRYPRCWDMEWSLPRASALVFWTRIQEITVKYMEQGKYPLNLAMHARFLGDGRSSPPGDETSPLLSPAGGRRSCYLEVVTIDGTPGAEDFFKELQKTILKIEGARPHWGKYFDEAAIDEICRRYPEIELARRAQREMDRDGVFLNPLLQRIFRKP